MVYMYKIYIHTNAYLFIYNRVGGSSQWVKGWKKDAQAPRVVHNVEHLRLIRCRQGRDSQKRRRRVENTMGKKKKIKHRKEMAIEGDLARANG